MKYKFKFKLFGSKAQMFNEGRKGIVIEKEREVVCIYGTTEKYQILCAIPLCHPKFLKDAEYIVDFYDNEHASVTIGDLQIVIYYEKGKCACNKDFKCYGSDSWGQDVQVEWGKI